MATIKYKNLFLTALRHLSVQQLINMRKDLIGETNVLRKRENEVSGKELTSLKHEIENLVAQVGLISGYIQSKLVEPSKCEICGKYTDFTGNLCEECFDAECDKLYEQQLDDE